MQYYYSCLKNWTLQDIGKRQLNSQGGGGVRASSEVGKAIIQKSSFFPLLVLLGNVRWSSAEYERVAWLWWYIVASFFPQRFIGRHYSYWRYWRTQKTGGLTSKSSCCHFCRLGSHPVSLFIGQRLFSFFSSAWKRLKSLRKVPLTKV